MKGLLSFLLPVITTGLIFIFHSNGFYWLSHIIMGVIVILAIIIMISSIVVATNEEAFLSVFTEDLETLTTTIFPPFGLFERMSIVMGVFLLLFAIFTGDKVLFSFTSIILFSYYFLNIIFCDALGRIMHKRKSEDSEEKKVKI